MKTCILLITLGTLAVSLALAPRCLLAQGILTPPGAPAPTMKSLAQIEPRTPISAAPFTVAVGGSYYLTTNVTFNSGVAITIAANNVTLDLSGFTIASAAASPIGSAILFNGGVTNVFIHDGHISSGATNNAAGVFGGTGFASGITYSATAPSNVRVKNVSVSGLKYYGILLGTGNSSVVESCTVNVAGNYGIFAENVSDSTALNCGVYGIYCDTAHNCKGSGVGSGGGLWATIANNCLGSSSGSGHGLYALDVASGCSGYSNTGTGLLAFIANGCRGQTTSGTSLNVTHNINSF